MSIGSLGTLWSHARSIGSLERPIGSLAMTSQDPAILRMGSGDSR